MKRFVKLSAFAAVAGLACSLASASVTIYGGPTFSSDTGTGYWGPQLPGATAGNATAVAWAEKFNGDVSVGYRAVRWDASGSAAVELGNLGTKYGYTSTSVYAINSAGTAVGQAEKYSGNTSLGFRAVRWAGSGTAATELGHIGAMSNGFTFGLAHAVNDAGTTVGYAAKYSANLLLGYRAVRWDASGTTATELGNLGTNTTGYTYSEAVAVNSSGTAVGYANRYSGDTSLGARAVRWAASGTAATELANLGTDASGYTSSKASAVNSAGTSVGYSYRYAGNTNLGWSAVRWDASGTAVTELGNLGTTASGYTENYASNINSAGTAVGFARKYDGNISIGIRAVRWDASGTAAIELDNLGTDGSYRATRANAINEAGIIVGWAEKYSGNTLLGNRAVYWRASGVVIDLNTLLSPADAATWTLTIANAISDTDWVTGIGIFDPDGPGGLEAYERAFLLQIPHGGTCLSDFNYDGFVNGDDYDMFASFFELADPGADVNSDGFVNGDDYDAFASAFEAGC